MSGAVITQPVMLDTALLLPCANEGWHCRFSRLVEAVGLD
jgi:hypothetical protein